ncbi:DUF542 domain-containing protein [Dawidia soli]|uniref:DUF542 domain-containing protein n=1 Tax=Dawidia soli TaxID=2782352 RepID=A0AAP2D7W2_9BACT|nr:DUF542 domain-containing protein [Dawidia soli]MBT1687093.1 DUF542 domain-containing protein [Dawidia soli]
MNLVATVYDVVVFFPHAVEILDRYNVDYYCRGATPFIEACQEKDLDAAVLWREIVAAAPADSRWKQTWDGCAADFLSDLILNHADVLNTELVMLQEVLNQVLKECSKAEEPKISAIHACFTSLCAACRRHTHAEEELLLKPLRNNVKGRGRPAVRAGLAKMEKEHLYLADLIHALRCLTGNYSMQELSSPSVALAGVMLQGLDKTLTHRLHLENNVLFPKLKASQGCV